MSVQMIFNHQYGHYIQSQRYGFSYLPWVALSSISDISIVDGIFNQDLHDFRWYEAEATRLGGNYFDRFFGMGLQGFNTGNPVFFNRVAFIQGTRTAYFNPRSNRNIQQPFNENPRFHWTDTLIGGFNFGSPWLIFSIFKMF